MSVPESEKNDINYWAKRWVESRTGWHMDAINPILIKYLEVLTGSSEKSSSFIEANSKKKIFVPLCGKTKDLGYLLSLGYQVFSIEGVLQAIQELDKENNFQLSFDENESIYGTSDGKLKIFFGDLFKCPIEKWGPFDFIWDRGSLIAMDYSARGEYIKFMQKSVQDSNGKFVPFRYLLEVVDYDRTKFPGPPRPVEENEVIELYSSWSNYKLLERIPLPENHSLRKVPDMNSDIGQSWYLVSTKN